MRLLLLSSSFNSLTQQAYVLFKDRHQVGVAAATTAGAMREVVAQFRPDLILCPMLAHVIPRDIWSRTPCLIVHPGIVGDRGPSSLDWAIYNGETAWGVTVVEAVEHMDSGPIWATYRCAMREGSKSSLYRDEITRCAVKAMEVAVQRFESRMFVPAPLDYARAEPLGHFRPVLKQAQRRVDWESDRVADILRKVRTGDGAPGVLDEIAGQEVYLFGAHEESALVGKPGDIITQRHGAICRAAVDGAVWISHLKPKNGPEERRFKLPAAMVLGPDAMQDVPELPLFIDAATRGKTFRDIWYEEKNSVGYVNFRFYNGAMGTDHCRRLEQAVLFARRRPTRVIVLQGGRDFWSNGIHLNLIEAAADPAQESWNNINAMDDLCKAILTASDQLVIAAMYGSAGAGGVMMALAADRVLARDGIVLNPHYKGMGGLYGSEYWTYSLPRRVGLAKAVELTERCLPLGIREAKAIGLVDDIIVQDDLGGSHFSQFREQIGRIAEQLASSGHHHAWLEGKRAERAADERRKPLAAYREEELAEMRRNFWGEAPAYHLARSAFVRKVPKVGLLKCVTNLDAACGNAHCADAPGLGRNRRSFASIGWQAVALAATP
ncbi:hydrogenase maturation protein [Sorangium sp. So ce1504]|uniref:hydrogenase maturation protein n=1 Tax=Sorangium sp. So ce1504 TaxID=3133337 RepID=UPI003F5D94EF